MSATSSINALFRYTAVFAAFLACLSILAGPVVACAFDMVKPERTKIDWIVDAEKLVLARPQPTNPFAFETTEVLFGDTDAPPIDQLVDRTMRQQLALQPSASVLFAYLAETGWYRVALVDNGFRPLLETALTHRAAWQSGMPQSRLDFILSLQDNQTATHKAILIGELDKVPYADLQRLDLLIDDEALIADLWSLSGYPYQAIRALLLGLSGTEAARQEIASYITRVTDWNWADNLGAFAAAYIELEGAAGVEHLADRMLLDPGQPLDKLEQIVMAMSVHHQLADPQTRTAIQQAIRTLVSGRSDAGAVVARQFSLRSDWSQTPALEPLVRERKVGLGDLLTISVYLARSREEVATPVD